MTHDIKTIHYVLEHIEVIGFRRFNDAVKVGAGIGTVSCLTEQPIFAANHEGFYRALCSVMVYVQLYVQTVALQFRPLIQAILNGFTQFSFGQHLLLRL